MNATAVYNDLVHHYAEPGRCYHTWAHVVHCLLEFDRAAAQIENPDAVELALWFHDAVFVPGARNNEQQSADLFCKWGTTALSPTFINQVRGLILVTTHRQPPLPGDQSYVVDIDLSSFGIEWAEFIQDTLRVRKERPEIPDDIYYPAHAKFLQMLLDRPSIFHTDFFHDLYEESARRNIQRLLTTDFYPKEEFDVDCMHSH